MNEQRLTIVFTREMRPHGWTAETPDLPDFRGYGGTIDEACRSLLNALVLVALTAGGEETES